MPDGAREPVKLLPVMRPFHEERRRHKVARGGRGGGKSWCIARLLLLMGVERKLRILCAREVQKSIKDSVHKLLADQIEAMGLSAFYDVQATTIKGRNGTEFVYTGLRDHTTDSIKSYEGCDICWIEEAARVSQHSATILIPTIRKAGSELWWSYNPDQEDDYVHADIAKRSDALVVDVSYRDNLWFPAELEQERLALKAINDDLYQHVWEGKCRSIAGLLFKRAWFRRYDKAPEQLSIYLASDYGVTEDGGDHTEHGVFGLDPRGDLYVLDWWSGQTAPEAWIDGACALIERWKPLAWYDENGVIRRALDAAITKRLRERGVWIYREGMTSAGSKAERALGFAARASAGAVYFPRNEWADRVINQLCSFTGEDGRPDDAVDACSLVARALDRMRNATPARVVEDKSIKPFTRAHIEAAERMAAMDAAEREGYYR